MGRARPPPPDRDQEPDLLSSAELLRQSWTSRCVCIAVGGSALVAQLGVYHDGALVIQHLPLSGHVLPERRPAGDALCLPEGVRQQVHIRTDPAAVDVDGLPLILICLPVPRCRGCPRGHTHAKRHPPPKNPRWSSLPSETWSSRTQGDGTAAPWLAARPGPP